MSEFTAKDQLFEQTLTIEDALLKLEKADTLLNHWLQEYAFYENPDPGLIFNNRVPNDDTRKTQAQKWYWEYNYIFKFIDIVSDYICDSKEILSKLIRHE